MGFMIEVLLTTISKTLYSIPRQEDNRFHDNNLCGVADLGISNPEPHSEFSCPYREPEVCYKCSISQFSLFYVQTHTTESSWPWPWLGRVTNVQTNDIYLGKYLLLIVWHYNIIAHSWSRCCYC